MITIVNLNPCVDWQYNIPVFVHGGTNRVRRTYQGAASKGMNVAVALKNLGIIPSCIGFNFVDGGEKTTEKFDSLNIPHDFETVEGNLRVNIKVFEESTGIMTELNQPGDFVAEKYVKNLENKVAKLSDKDGILVLTGSLPAGAPTTIYATLAKLWTGKVILDADGDTLRNTILANVPIYAAKPNLSELENAFGVKLSSKKDVVEFCRRKLQNVKYVCVSMGADGALLVTQDTDYFCPALKLEVKGIQGAGDSMVAGLIYGMRSGLPPQGLLCCAMAAAAASIIKEGTEMCLRTDFDLFKNNFSNSFN